MADTPSNASVDDSTRSKIPAPKDKNCPFCNQAFTSSSLGRHLDLYIKPTNPKAPDGIHDAEEIRRIRSGITRRQAKSRGSLAGSSRGQSCTPGATPTATSRRLSVAPSDGGASSALSPADRRVSNELHKTTAHIRSQYPFAHNWQTTGVINDIPGPHGEPNSRAGDNGDTRRPGSSSQQQARAIGREALKAQLEMKQKIQDAQDTARAAELAIREMLSSWRAAKVQIDMNSMPFDFNPLALDFPALTLRCLSPPPTIFSSTQVATPTSWSISPPAQQQYDALRNYFDEEFRKWRITCASATTVAQDDMQYPPSHSAPNDTKEAILRAEKNADRLQTQVNDHLLAVYNAWRDLSDQQKQDTWFLEMARNMSTKHSQIENMKEEQQKLRQEIRNLKSERDALSRLQHPREFKIMPPMTFPTSQKYLDFMLEESVVRGRTGIGFSVDGRHEDIGPVVAAAIERWKNVIVSTRAQQNGMNAQRALDQAALAIGGPVTPVSENATAAPSNTAVDNAANNQGQPRVPSNTATEQPRPVIVAAAPTAPAINGTSNHSAPASDDTDMMEEEQEDAEGEDEDEAGPAVEEDDMSDQDADAEMEDDYERMNPSQPSVSHQDEDQQAGGQEAPAVPSQQNGQLHVPRTRGPGLQQHPQNWTVQQQTSASGGVRSFTHAGHGGRAGMTMPGPHQSLHQEGNHGGHNGSTGEMYVG